MIVNIIVVNYRTPGLLKKCVESILKNDNNLVGYCLTIIDNGSKDGLTEQFLARNGRDGIWKLLGERGTRLTRDQTLNFPWHKEVLHYPSDQPSATHSKLVEVEQVTRGKSLTLIHLASNYGYETAVNVGFIANGVIGSTTSVTGPDIPGTHFVLLGSDVEIFPDTIPMLLKAFDIDTQIGIVGAKLVQEKAGRWYVIAGGYQEIHGREHIHGWNDDPHGDWQQFAEYPWVTFSAVAIRRELVQELGAMDMTFHVNCGDADYCRRARRMNWASIYSPAAMAIHHESKTVSLLQQETPPAVWRSWMQAERSYFHNKYKDLNVPPTILSERLFALWNAQYRNLRNWTE